MSGQYTITFTSPSKPSFVINSLETEGPGSVNTVPVVSANVAADAFTVSGDFTPRFTAGFDFRVINSLIGNNSGVYTVNAVTPGAGGTWKITGNHQTEFFVGETIYIVGNTGIGNATYTVASATNNGANTDIVVNETIPGAATANGSLQGTYKVLSSVFQGTSAINSILPVPKKFVLNGFDYTKIFTSGRIFKIVNSTAPSTNDGYWIVASSIFNAGNTEIVVQTGVPVGFRDGNTIDGSEFIPTGSIVTNLTAIVPTTTIPVSTTIPDGSIQYTLTGHTSLTLPGRGAINYGLNIDEDLVHILENFYYSSAPVNPTRGQLWFDSVSNELKVYDNTNTFVPLATATPVQSAITLTAQTTIAAPVEMFINGVAGSRIVLLDNTTVTFAIDIAARRTNGSENAGYSAQGTIKRDVGAATTAIVGSVIPVNIAEDDITWDFLVIADIVNGSLKVSVTGAVGKNISWVATVRLTQAP